MKSLITILSAIFLTVSLGGEIPYVEIAKGFNQNSSHLILKSSGEKIILDLPDKNGVYSLEKANIHLQTFLDNHPNGEFTYILRGKKSDEGIISIGRYERKNEKFNVNLFFKWKNGAHRLESLSIRKDQD